MEVHGHHPHQWPPGGSWLAALIAELTSDFLSWGSTVVTWASIQGSYSPSNSSTSSWASLACMLHSYSAPRPYHTNKAFSLSKWGKDPSQASPVAHCPQPLAWYYSSLIIALSMHSKRWSLGLVSSQVLLAWKIVLHTQELYKLASMNGCRSCYRGGCIHVRTC